RAARSAGRVVADLREQPDGQRARSEQGPPRPGARGSLHGGRRQLPDRHGRLRRSAASGHDADRARRSALRVRPHLPQLERAGGGVTEPSVYDSDDDLARAVLASDDPALAGITLERLKADGWARLNVPTPFVPFADGFPTPSGRLEFVSARMREIGL